jgi:competence/damage-inducible protein CinA-like protein
MALAMSAEIITIGTELLNGLGRDTNGARIAAMLASIGIEVHYQTTVGDDAPRMADVFRAAAHRAQVVITTGGLGATSDDLTRKTIATVFRRRLVLDEAVLDHIRARFRVRGIEMPAINEAQALVPRGARIIENPRGLAPGLHFTHLETDYFSLPGVPAEADAMMEGYVLPYLRSRRPAIPATRRVVRTVGVSESVLAERLRSVEAEEERIRVGYLPHIHGVDITLAPIAPDLAWMEDALDRCERRVRELAGEHAYGSEGDTLSAVVGALLLERRATLATAESFTAGAVGATITATPGASRYYLGGIIAYSNRAKQELLGVRATTLERHGAVSAEAAEEMAAGARSRFDCDVALSSTGIAGPDGGSADKPIGLVYFGVATAEGVRTARFVLPGTRAEIAGRSVAYLLDLARRQLAPAAV